MDKIDFISMVEDILDDCATSDAIDHRVKEMISVIQSQGELSKEYLKIGLK